MLRRTIYLGPKPVNDEQRKQIPLAWVVDNEFVTENQKPLDFGSHRILIQPFNDMHPNIVARKSAQIGWTTMCIYRCIHMAAVQGMNIAYTLPTKNVIKEMIVPKVNPIFDSNPKLKELLTQDSQNVKRVGNRTLFFRGAWTERDAISVTVDCLVHDELDRSDQKVINIYRSRTQASEYKRRERFSNPSVPGYGVDLLWSQSDQMHWLITCETCAHESYMSHEPDDDWLPHYLDMDQKIFACGNPDCDGEISDLARTLGRWVPKYAKRANDATGAGVRGYWISQLMVPWVSAAELVEIFNDPDTTPEYWYNFVLGLPYQNAELTVNREVILRATTPNVIQLNEVAIGVDNGVIKHWVMMTPQGIFDYGQTESWDDIEAFLTQFPNSKMVIDANPYPDIPTKLAEKYPGRVWINYYEQDKTGLATIRWLTGEDDGVVKVDRTKIFDQVAGEFNRRDLISVMRHQQMEGYIGHWAPMYRTIEVNAKQQKKGVWLTQENRADHWAHATIYSRVALYQASTGFTGGLMPNNAALLHTAEYKGYFTPGVQSIPGVEEIAAMVDPKEEAETAGVTNRGWRH